MIERGELSPESGFEYKDENDVVMFECHVDEHISFQSACQDIQYGGYLSVRFPPGLKKVMMLGQDKAIMRKYIFTLLAWTMPDGARPLIPKDEGYGLMVSAITCCEFGFGLTVSDHNLTEINEKREGKNTVMRVLQQKFMGHHSKKTWLKHHL